MLLPVFVLVMRRIKDGPPPSCPRRALSSSISGICEVRDIGDKDDNDAGSESSSKVLASEDNINGCRVGDRFENEGAGGAPKTGNDKRVVCPTS